jgi:hypothetical protein
MSKIAGRFDLPALRLARLANSTVQQLTTHGKPKQPSGCEPGGRWSRSTCPNYFSQLGRLRGPGSWKGKLAKLAKLANFPL